MINSATRNLIQVTNKLKTLRGNLKRTLANRKVYIRTTKFPKTEKTKARTTARFSRFKSSNIIKNVRDVNIGGKVKHYCSSSNDTLNLLQSRYIGNLMGTKIQQRNYTGKFTTCLPKPSCFVPRIKSGSKIIKCTRAAPRKNIKCCFEPDCCNPSYCYIPGLEACPGSSKEPLKFETHNLPNTPNYPYPPQTPIGHVDGTHAIAGRVVCSNPPQPCSVPPRYC